MSKILLALLMTLAAATSAAGDRSQVFAASTTGELQIDAEGRVAALTLQHKSLGEEVMSAFEDRIRGWRFEPVHDGAQPVPISAKLRLDLLAVREPGEDGLALAIRNVQFLDAPMTNQASAGGSSGPAPVLVRPNYPVSLARLNIGGTVWLAVRIGPEGRVAEAAAEAVELRTERADGVARQRAQARELTRASELAARGWQLPGLDGRTVTIPVRFRISNDRGERWMRIHNVPLEVPAWVVAERGAAVRLSESGEQDSARIRLLSAVN